MLPLLVATDGAIEAFGYDGPLRQRCIMTSYDPDTQVHDKEITRSIYRRFEGTLALDCFVLEGGAIAVGDEVQLVR